MAPLPEIDDVYRVAFNWTHEDTPWTATNVMHFRKSASDPSTVFATIDANVTAAMWEVAPAHGHISSVVVTPLDGGSVSFPVNTGSGAKWSGPITGGLGTPQVCALVKTLTAKRGRSYRGRIYIPWASEQNVTNGRVDSGNVTAGQSAWEAFVSDMAGDGCDLVVASYKLATAEDVIAVLFERDVATQRRRNHRVSA